jgi:hypothetical protein
MWRRSAIDEAGGWEHDTLTEDTDLSYRAQLKGWKFVYLQDVECPAELPVEMTAFKTQQARWAKGLIQVSKKILPRVLKSDVPPRENRSLVSPDGQSQLSADDRALGAADARHDHPLLPGMVPDALHRPAPVHGVDIFHFQLLSGFAKRAVSETLAASLLYLPLLMSLGIGLTITNTIAVLEALVGKQTAFARTPKYRVESKKDKVLGAKYRKRLGWVPWIELLIGTYFALAIFYAIDNENYFTIPFPALVRSRLLGHGLMSLLQGRFAGLSVGFGNPHQAIPGWSVGSDFIGACRLPVQELRLRVGAGLRFGGFCNGRSIAPGSIPGCDFRRSSLAEDHIHLRGKCNRGFARQSSVR